MLTPVAEPIFHIALPDEWLAAQPRGEYRISTRGLTLDEVGFIHCSQRHQVAAVANAFYADAPSLVLLVIDPDQLTAAVRLELVDGGELFPHIYGPIDVAAVVDVMPFEPGPDGVFTF
jgi:glutathione S-transferase